MLLVHHVIMKNVIQVLACLSNPEGQVVLGWIGFNIRAQDDIDVVGDIVAHIPTINSLATHLSTV